MRGVHLDAVEAGLPHAHGGLGHEILAVLDFLDGQSANGAAERRRRGNLVLGQVGRADGQAAVDGTPGRGTHVVQLANDLAAIAVHAVRVLLHAGDEFVVGGHHVDALAVVFP